MNRPLLKALVFAGSLFLSAGAFAGQNGRREVVDAGPRWSGYDAYIHRMMSGIDSRWERILADSKTCAPAGTFVAVKFVMDSKGRITEILDVGSTSSEPGGESCITALTLSAPFGAWTDDMVHALGASQVITVRFYY